MDKNLRTEFARLDLPFMPGYVFSERLSPEDEAQADAREIAERHEKTVASTLERMQLHLNLSQFP